VRHNFGRAPTPIPNSNRGIFVAGLAPLGPLARSLLRHGIISDDAMQILMSRTFPLRPRALLFAALFTVPGCAAHSGKDDTPGDGVVQFDGPSVPVAETEKVPAQLSQALEVASEMDGDALLAAYPAPAAALGYDARQAAGLDLIQGSALALSDDELERLAEGGVVLSTSKQFPSFAYGYKTIYAEDLPVYVSADSILEAVHRTFDRLLSQVEQQVLSDELGALLSGMRTRLPERFADSTLTADADLYLTVAQSLLEGSALAPAASARPDDVRKLWQLATSASGHESVTLFSATRDEDFSQFEPRGHYTDSEQLQRYFRAMMWLGRVDLRIVETQSDGSQLFRRPQFDAAVALRELMGEPELELWDHVDAVIGAFVGEHDSMTVRDLDGLMAALGVSSVAEAQQLSDDAIVSELASGGWGAQRIASRIIVNGGVTKTLPLDRSFLLFGQRYTVDSHTFVNVTYDRVAGRLMPKPLDTAFAALGNDAALALLAPEFDNISYVQGLAKTRALVDAHEPAYWEGSLYTRWLGALRSLSPDAAAPPAGAPATDAWQRRVLAAQLGSWAELRHDTILYVKQSYTAGAVCEFPDAYVDPYPEFYARLGDFAQAMSSVADGLPASAATLRDSIRGWAEEFSKVMANLTQMAENQVTGTPHSQELLDFINDAVKWDEQSSCGGTSYTNLAGWYLRLYLDEYASLAFDPTIADVHTQPTDAGGNDVGRILHVGTGQPRLMVVSADTCTGPRAYAGLAFAYGERITENWERLNDQEWLQYVATSPFPDPDWMAPVLGR
jgi:hypothetical protein